MLFQLGDYACPAGVGSVIGDSAISMTLADLTLDDQPIVAVNGHFCSMTGYDPEFVLGRNCRFLQPPGGAGPVRGRIREFLSSQTPTSARFVVSNVSASGAPFVNIVYLAKLSPHAGLRLVLGSQFVIDPSARTEEFYDRALRHDVQTLTDVTDGPSWLMAGSMDAISNTTALVAQYKLQEEELKKHGTV